MSTERSEVPTAPNFDYLSYGKRFRYGEGVGRDIGDIKATLLKGGSEGLPGCNTLVCVFVKPNGIDYSVGMHHVLEDLDREFSFEEIGEILKDPLVIQRAKANGLENDNLMNRSVEELN